MDGNTQWTRRLFSAAVAGSPVLIAQEALAPAAPKPVPPPPNRLPRVEEKPLFGETLVFTRNEAEPRATPYPLPQVRLLAGPCQEAADHNRAFLLRLSPDRLLHTFRLNAGLASSAKPLGGWEAPKMELRGHTTGHYLSACALRTGSAGDQDLKARGDEMVEALARCQKSLGRGGYLSAFPVSFFDRLDQRTQVWAPFYTYHKIMAGLLDMYVHAGNRQALEVASGMGAWADEWSASKSEAHMQEILKEEFGGMSEVFYNLAAATGDLRWAKAGDRFHKKEFLTPLAQHVDALRGLHTNTHIPQVIGAARRFELTSDPRFRTVAEFFWYTVASARSYATGGSSNAEHWLTAPGSMAAEWRASSHHQECCCAYNMMKLTRQLYAWDGDPRYFDYYERNLFNHRLGQIQPETGHSVYFLSMAPGAWKGVCSENQSFWCCTGTAFEEYSKLNDSIYFRYDGGIAVNLFIASELDDRTRAIGLRQDTRFPEEPRTTLTITKAPAASWTLRLRIPSWTTAASVKVNGRLLETTPGAGSYLSLTRAWKHGDRVELDLPMQLTAEPFPDDSRVQAFLYGPIVLAGDLGAQGLTEKLVVNRQWPELRESPMNVPELRASGKRLEDWIKPDASKPLTFHAAGLADVPLRPLNGLWGRFATYWGVA
ncbi:glycoside hydrolase family 127 protein [uncultured Paludibaculum sp.]|uniref:glycoside hydrolase family 127 protein n=1 Tax=uncultured Paludibaculum sp. TaxID=1765020 RepID=UPI002AAC29F9|nr:glycoside hydrolase family 127 protein [uncultured Paludibaculum sp.]